MGGKASAACRKHGEGKKVSKAWVFVWDKAAGAWRWASRHGREKRCPRQQAGEQENLLHARKKMRQALIGPPRSGPCGRKWKEASLPR